MKLFSSFFFVFLFLFVFSLSFRFFIALINIKSKSITIQSGSYCCRSLYFILFNFVSVVVVRHTNISFQSTHISYLTKINENFN